MEGGITMIDLHEIAADGAYTSTDVLKKQYIEKIAQKASDLMAVGTKVVHTEGFDDLHVEYSYAGEVTGHYPVAEGVGASDEKMKWKTFKLELEKGIYSMSWTKESVIRGVSKVQQRQAMARMAEAMAKDKDYNIIDTLVSGNGSTDVPVNASKKWNLSAADIDKDVMDAWGNILNESNVQDHELSNVGLLVPAKCGGYLKRSTMIGNIDRSWEVYLKDQWGITIHPTRRLTTDAILMVKGEKTATHGYYTGGKVPTVELKQNHGVGSTYTLTTWFGTAINQDKNLTNQSYRIVKITGVL